MFLRSCNAMTSILLWQLFINLLLLLTMIINIQTSPDDILKETNLPTVDMIKKYGYAAEIHDVKTQDSYVLELHRIIKNRKGKTYTRNYPVVITHSLMGSSADWIVAGPSRSLGLQLTDDGFDVWLVNFRGNTYSKEYAGLFNNSYDYWNFSLHEHGVYDLPAVIDYVLEMTKTKQLHYIGFSMGTTAFFIFASERPEYQEKIRSNISLAPVANIFHSTSIYKTYGLFYKSLHPIVRMITFGEIFAYSKNSGTFMKYLCKPKFLKKYLCLKMMIFNSCGKDPYSFDEDLLPYIFGHSPAGTSSKVIVHISQFITTETFGQYDYGAKKNIKHYNSKYPPSYNLESIRVPIYIFHGENDILANPTDVEKLRNQLPNVMEVIKVDNKYFNHFDFIYSKYVVREINDPVKKILQLTDNENWKAENSKKIQLDNGS